MIKSICKKHIFSLLFVGVMFLAGGFVILQLDSEVEYQTILVKNGDSLWSLADDYHHLHLMKTEEFVEWVEAKNHLYSETIKPGDTLIVPIKVTKENMQDHIALKEE
ncbi:hypothetical protein J2S13_001065 [Oikeobacillus pervagus]|uniref:LysM domain-containing protein n=1 Tax=Oikeobacillus pervagus TaxID=1325931 RepID=A0AAJ1WIQ9_9BACI|nr:LysM peptidoglycan-binding domain-containing protein [Oikeobacillus pervagus]MDQ0214668.1 hypothetical protein [Oikeobacillus pervagus]